MIVRLHVVMLALGLFCVMLPGISLAGFDEGLAAYNKKDYATALRELRPLATQGNASAQRNLGMMYAHGQGVPQDDKEAMKWYRLAAAQGHAPAQMNLGFMYDYGQVVPQDHKEAVKWYRLAAEQGYAAAQMWLGFMYSNGLGGDPRDYKEAVKWFRLAAAQGHADAQDNIGEMYANGQGVPQDFKEAVKWFRLAAAQGNADAQNNLGWMYANGQGVPQDYKEAVKWYRLAAAQEHASAQNNLGAAYYHGQGISPNHVAAYALFNLSAAGDPSKENKASANRAALAESMSTKEIETAQNLTREMTKTGNTLKVLDQYLKNPTVKEKPSLSLSTTKQAAPASDDYPARPAKRPGVVSCNTRCINADCWRTYDDGQKVRFQAQRKYDSFSGQWKFDSGGC